MREPQGDSRDDRSGEIDSGLHRKLGTAASVAIAFSATGVSAGVYSLFGFSLYMSGPALIWGWVFVGLGTFGICLMWAELASHYPVAGVMYEWPRRLVGERSAWWVSWIYLFAMMFQLAGIYFILPAVLLPLFEVEQTRTNTILIAMVALIVAAISNVAAIERVGKLVVVAAAAELVITFVITLGVLVLGHHQSPSIFLQPATPGQGFSDWLPAFLGGGMFLGLWVMQNFEAGGAIGEETIEAPRRAPKAIISGWTGTFLVGLFTIAVLLLAIPDLEQVIASPDPVVTIIDDALAPWVGKAYLALLATVIILGANAVFTLVSRQVFGMARSGRLPFSRQMLRTHPRTGEPWVAVVVTAVITATPFVLADQFAVLATGASAAIYLVYLAMAVLLLHARLRGWPRHDAPMRLGRWGLPVNVFMVLYCAAAFVNLMWFRDTTNPRWHGLPVTIWMLAVPVLLGAIYRTATFVVPSRLEPELDIVALESD